MGERTVWELAQKQALPLDEKIKLTKQRIREWVDEFGEDGTCVSFSGGKDSTVLLDIVRSMYPGIGGAYMDTGLEFPEIRDFVKGFDNIEWLKPKLNFKDIVTKYGYPMISKEVSGAIYETRNAIDKLLGGGGCDYVGELNRIANEDVYQLPVRAAHLLDINIVGWTQAKKCRVPLDQTTRTPCFRLKRHQYLLNAPFRISDRCCYYMKKSVAYRYIKQSGKNFITAQMASEGAQRKNAWLKYGCNGLNMRHPMSKPMAFWTEQDVLLYIVKNQLKIASVYGEIVGDEESTCPKEESSLGLFDLKRPLLKTTLANRTGCAFCGFGCHLEKKPNRFEVIDMASNPKIRDYIMRGGAFDDDGMWKPSPDGLGLWFVLQWINVHGGYNIYIPEYNRYSKEYGNNETAKCLIAD